MGPRPAANCFLGFLLLTNLSADLLLYFSAVCRDGGMSRGARDKIARHRGLAERPSNRAEAVVEAAKGKEEEYSHLIQQMDGNGNTRPPPLLTKRLCGRDKRRARTLGSRFSPHMLRLRRPLLGSGHAQEARIMAHFSRF